MRQEFLIALGSNMVTEGGNRVETLGSAIRMLNAHAGRVTRVSRFFSTPCFPVGAGPDYVNACIALESDVESLELIKKLHEIEELHGRERPHRWASRTLDLDLIAAGNAVLPDAQTLNHWMHLPLEDQMKSTPDGLILPHPRLHQRAFVLVPLMDIAPGWFHPALRRHVTQMLQDLPPEDLAEILPL
ncbi:MAG: 2-amino-4-hydroxy-6-hydroxymethyldihydropteridine diphosphokinase [Pelagimonas sp.]|jgi:2-amino-4-hydroxy-6-hydroxymethyldihydropteridine diphosphokinase|nr:2-amino-4-hydroxy-6-hydroxymethyldihydropteridine diphosphokinase [Pelagimonas sp.]